MKSHIKLDLLSIMMASFDGYAYSKMTEDGLLPNVFQSPGWII